MYVTCTLFSARLISEIQVSRSIPMQVQCSCSKLLTSGRHIILNFLYLRHKLSNKVLIIFFFKPNTLCSKGLCYYHSKLLDGDSYTSTRWILWYFVVVNKIVTSHKTISLLMLTCSVRAPIVGLATVFVVQIRCRFKYVSHVVERPEVGLEGVHRGLQGQE